MDDPITVEQFCRKYVEPMGEESDHIHIVAITDALQVSCYAKETSRKKPFAHLSIKLASHVTPSSASSCQISIICAYMICKLLTVLAQLLSSHCICCQVDSSHHHNCWCLQIPIRVVYLDRSMAAFAGAASEDAAAVNHHDFVPEAMQKDTAAAVHPRVYLLYRPGHYDILYPTSAS